LVMISDESCVIKEKQNKIAAASKKKFCKEKLKRLVIILQRCRSELGYRSMCTDIVISMHCQPKPKKSWAF